MTTKGMAIGEQLEALRADRKETHRDMLQAVRGKGAKVDTQWFKDRANHLEYLNRAIARLEAAVVPVVPEGWDFV